MPAKAKKGAFTEAEEELLRNFSRETDSKGTVVFWVHALYVVTIPIWIQARVHQFPIGDSLVYLIIGTLLQAFALQWAYKNVKFVSKEKIASKRSDAVSAEINEKHGRSMAKQELDDRIIHRKNEVAERESIHFSIFYNNCIYLGLYLLFSVVFFKSSAPLMNYIVSIIMSAGVVAGISNTK